MEKIYQFIFKEETASKAVITGLVIIILAFLFFIIKGSWELSVKSNIDEGIIGSYGDFIGGFVGTIFSLVGVILFYVSLKEQREDFQTNQKALENQLEAFQQQIKEFELQREELGETRKIFEQQTKTMKNQQFESSFYSLLNVFIDNRNRINEQRLFKKIMDNMKMHSNVSDYTITIESVHENYFNEYISNKAELAMYFMALYRLFKIIEECHHLDGSEKTYYHKIIRALISKDELIVLYYNYHSDFGKKPLPIALKYDYFKHLETLSKIEFNKTFAFSDKEVIGISKILPKIKELLYLNIEKAKDLNTESIEESILLFENVFLGIYITDIIDIKLVIKHNLTEVLGIPTPKFNKIITYILIDLLFTSQFKTFSPSYLDESVTTAGNQVTYNYKFETPNE
ncbi:putative phage abortive infection protein [Elizabethkingia anophelis]|uniref:putative phage abortive infection protein n=1 Tax=Elizabethkingia anophelis TaxID=1117645 RepID=UPI0038914628